MCDLLITDYSSIMFDVAYRVRPIIYYQFDYDDFRKYHYKEGYFSYKKDGFGDVIKNHNVLINKIIYYCENNYKIEGKYKKKMIDFYPLKDKDNCFRITNEIERIDNID